MIFRSLLVAGLVLLASASPSSAANLVSNPGFEEPALSPWTAFAGAATLSRSTASPHGGSACVLASARTQAYGGPSQDLAPLLVTGQRYIVSAWVRAGADTDTRVSLNIKRVVGGSTSYIPVDSLATGHQRWVKLSGSYLHDPSGTPSEASVYVVGPDPSIDLFVDDVSVEPWPEYAVTPSTPADFVRRSGAGLVVGAANTPLRLLGVNFTAYDDESESADAVLRSHEFDPEVDFARVAALGGNVVRLNLWWKVFENESAPYTYKQEGWDWLERNIVAARAAGVRLILDMHAPQGGFQGPGSTSSYWNSAALQARHDALMTAIATRYADEPWIAAYDVLNEPSPPNDAAWRTRAAALVAAIRSVDANHLVIVEQSFADDYGPFLLADPSILYEYHWYERWRYASQLSYPNGSGDYGISYPDADVTVPPWDDVPGALEAGATAASGTTPWTELVGTPFTVNDAGVFGGVPVAWATSMTGKLWVDDLKVEELDGSDNVVRTLTSIDIEKKPVEWWLLDEYEPWHSFTSDWSPSAISGSGSWGVESSGHRGDASISIRSASGTFTVGAHKLLFALKQGHRYRIRGWVKGEALTGSAGLGVRLYEYAPWETFTPFTKAWLEDVLMSEGGTFYANAGVPVNIGEFGQSPRNFTASRGNGQWAVDMLDLFGMHGMSAQWFDWHSGNFGAYTNTLGFPEPVGANQPLLDVLADAFGGPGLPNLIAIAGRDRSVRVGTAVEVDGSGSVGTIASWLWEQAGGPVVTLSGETTPVVSFTGPSSPGAVTLRLTVTGDVGTSEDLVTISFVEPCPTLLDETSCIDAYTASISIDERRSGSEKLKVQWKGFTAATTTGDFGNPVSGDSRYSLCLYGDGALAGEYLVERAGASCSGSPCWKASGAGWSYKDSSASADGLRTIALKPGSTGGGSAKLLGQNKASRGLSSLPTGAPAALQSATDIVMQLRVDDGACVSTALGWTSAKDATRLAGGR